MIVRNMEGNPATGMAADVIQGDNFTHRFVTTIESGVQTMTLRDIATGEIVGRHTAPKGQPVGQDAAHRWIEETLKGINA